LQDTQRAELLRILQAVTFPTPDTVALAGGTVVDPRAAEQIPGSTAPASSTVVQLQQLFYESCYCRRFGGAPSAFRGVQAPDSSFIETLAAANTSREHWDVGWRLQQLLPSGQIVAGKGALTRMVWPGEFLSHGPPGMPSGPGTEISLFVAKESRTIQPGFYYVFGEALADQEEELGPVRLYWNITAPGAAPLVAGITAVLNRFAIPFRFKCLSVPEWFDRADAAVLYIAKRHYRVAALLLADVHRAVVQSLKAATPLFTKPLADGLGLAEDPMTGESFGMNRCRLLAAAVCNAHARGLDTPEARLSEVTAAFAAAGLSLERPYLNGGSADAYAL